jgi:hypothetical protein
MFIKFDELLFNIKIIKIYLRMLSKLVAQANKPSLVNLSTRAFRASAVANKKPSIGDAVTILQSKVSGINQVVSIFSHPLTPCFQILE